ncbi:FG-GAP and VCBS repeat-containing protein [Streptomyces sp. NPDC047860]|uniref:FG-GAP and VCBS repeat-containing protein n=1 Tax=Streptomyces sp. NPDC047860 TaxID=3155743 RepID=UPI0033C94F96
MPSSRTVLAATAALATALCSPLFFAPTAGAAPAKLADDFNGDGYRDLVMLGGTHGKDGRVTVVYGTSTGPGTRVQVIHQDSAGVPGAVEEGDQWGFAATSADLDRDGYADLVVASPGEAVGDIQLRGGLTVVWGGAKGLGSGTVFHSPIAPEYAGSGDSFGEDVVAGDFDGDGDQDLAAVSHSRAGAILFQGPFTRSGGKAGWQSLGEDYEYLHASQLATGRVTADAATDLYILGSDLGDDDEAMGAFFHRGGAGFARLAGKLRVPDDLGHQVGGGTVTTVGDFDKDGYGDLAIGRGYENPDKGRGYVTVHYGGPSGPNTARKPVTFTQNTAGVPGGSEDDDHFGASVSAGDVNGDGYADLAIGAPGEDLVGKRDAGMVTVLLGRAGGLSGTGAKAYDQNTSGVAGGIENDDYFGWSVKLTDYTRDGRADLLVDTNDWLDSSRHGMVHLLKGSASGTTGTGSKTFTVNTLKMSYKTLSGPFPH